ncbi:Forkhead box protein I1 [Apophysomyces sp. BC1034]|nr:Forkhead box protein I1 [Apophysomyces sp. BC1021]KAG0191231.1 Forkhead box protein I1 [Apophysomyces sp. BC1034]
MTLIETLPSGTALDIAGNSASAKCALASAENDRMTQSSSVCSQDNHRGDSEPVAEKKKRRRPPFSYSSLIAQAILASEHERMTLRDIYKWITDNYPGLYDADDTGWQNTIRHNLSYNKSFKKIPKSEFEGTTCRGKGGYWTVDPKYMSKFRSGVFARGHASHHQKVIIHDRLLSRSNRTHPTLPLSASPSLSKMQISNILN